MESFIKDLLTDKIIEDAFQAFSFNKEECHFHGGFENLVYECRKNDQAYILRFVHSSHRVSDYVLAELEFIDYLNKHDASVSMVIPSKHNEFIEIFDANQGYFSVCLFNKAPGTFIKDEINDQAFVKYFGEEVGKLHSLTNDFKPKHKRYRFDEEDYISVSKKYLPKKYEGIYDIHDDLIFNINKIEETRETFGLIHTDLHFHNMFYDGKKLTFFDFDDASYKYKISDIAIILFYSFLFWNIEDDAQEKLINFLKTFLKGYRKYHPISEESLRQLPMFFKLREIILVLVLASSEEEKAMNHFIHTHWDYILDRKNLIDIEVLIKAVSED